MTVSVPATSANLGPGFDSFGLALDLCNEVTAEVVAARTARARRGRERRRRRPRRVAPGGPLGARDLRRARGRRAGPAPALLSTGSRTPAGWGRRQPPSSPASSRPGPWSPTAGSGWTRRRCCGWPPSSRGTPTTWPRAVLGGFTIAWCDGDGCARGPPRATASTSRRWCPPNPSRPPTARRLLPAQVDPCRRRVHRGPCRPAGGGAHRPPGPAAGRHRRPAAPAVPRPAMPQTTALVTRLRPAGTRRSCPGAGPTVLVLHGGAAPGPLARRGWRQLLHCAVDRRWSRSGSLARAAATHTGNARPRRAC